ncbi:hypothetical protein dsx2_1635 [Desulfovibrio sp. X2]|uniref:TIGR03943 family putative permease subunit n=1 Tax=Desulfovibrio sp. X2 TaxID=941449 RepID=UPI000358E868|nr:DUF1980 domain-containing protein [Desulfovibrio sp. X2]EPR44274.1 hypothetical protein dsx2_1635 [Desulfovibrio sp. X2]
MRNLLRLSALLEGLVLVALGLFIVHLARSGGYWKFLNPKFMPLSLAAAGLLLVFGLAAGLRRPRRANFLRVAVFGAFLVVCWYGGRDAFTPTAPPPARAATSVAAPVPSDHAQTSEETSAQAAPAPVWDEGGATPPTSGSAFSGVTAPHGEAAEPSRLTLGGKEYVKINLAELFFLCRDHPDEALAGRYVLRGSTIQAGELTRHHEFGVFRVSVWCCLADAVAVGLRVAGAPPAGLAPGEWVRVYGHLERKPAAKDLEKLHVRGVFSTIVDTNFVFVPERIDPIPDEEASGAPYIFEWRDHEPYAY